MSLVWCFGLTKKYLEISVVNPRIHSIILRAVVRQVLLMCRSFAEDAKVRFGVRLSLYYEQDLNLKEIGDVLGVSESRVSQIHSQATHRIKARLPE